MTAFVRALAFDSISLSSSFATFWHLLTNEERSNRRASDERVDRAGSKELRTDIQGSAHK